MPQGVGPTSPRAATRVGTPIVEPVEGVNPMDSQSSEVPLGQLSTIWSVVLRAHQGPVEARIAARRLLVERYRGAVRRYLNQLLRDAEAVNELCQEAAVMILSGAFHRADPGRGR